MVNDYTICDSCSTIELLLHPMAGLFNRCTEKVKVFSHFLAIMAEVDLWCIHALGKQTREGYSFK